MAEILHIKQEPVIAVGSLDVDEAEIVIEPYLRRASPEFAHEVGGPILQRFLELAYTNGYIHPNSLVRSQPSKFRSGAYTTPPHWHFDFLPGVSPSAYNSLEAAIRSNSGLIACVFDPAEHPDDEGTRFLQGDEIVLDLDARKASQEYVPGKNFSPDENEGELYWWDPVVRQQIGTNKHLTIEPLRPSYAYDYGSYNLHCVPLMSSDHGQRMVMRINTPTDSTAEIQVENRVLYPSDPLFPSYVFYHTSPTTWIRRPV